MFKPQRLFGMFVCGLLTLVLVAPGCGSGGQEASVKGKVTQNGEPVEAGSTIVFMGADSPDAVLSLPIGGGGSYSGSLPPGKYRIAVTPPAAPELSPEEAMKKSLESPGGMQSTSSIPVKYTNPATSPASTEIQAGDNTFDLDMTE